MVVEGQRVRVTVDTADGKTARRALVLTIDDDATAEIEYSDGTESRVPLSQCAALLPFEEAEDEETVVVDAETRKQQGNALFKLKDTAAAIEQYVAGIRLLSHESPASVGCRCLVKPDGNNATAVLRSAMVTCMDSDTVDITYDPDALTGGGRSGGGKSTIAQRLQALLRQAEAIDAQSMTPGGAAAAAPVLLEGPAPPCTSSDAASSSGGGSWLPWRWASGSGGGDTAAAQDGGGGALGGDDDDDDDDDDEEEDGVQKDRIVLVVHPQQPALQCALLLNSAKCSLMARDWGAALARALRAERCAANDDVERERTRTLRRTALIVCARAALGMQRFGKATTYAAMLLAAEMPEDAKDAAAAAKEVRLLLKDIQRRAAEVKRSNQRLAKSISTWVAAAMEESGQQLPVGALTLE